MGHLVFLFLHAAALYLLIETFFLRVAIIQGPMLAALGGLWLFACIPLHLVYGSVSARRRGEPSPWTHVRCPDCAELVRSEARLCPHCRCRLVPQSHGRSRIARAFGFESSATAVRADAGATPAHSAGQGSAESARR